LLASEIGWSTVQAIRERGSAAVPQDQLRLGASAVSDEAYARSVFDEDRSEALPEGHANPAEAPLLRGRLGSDTGTVRGPSDLVFDPRQGAQRSARLEDLLLGAEASKLLGSSEDGAQYAGLWLKGARSEFQEGSGQGERDGRLRSLHAGLDLRLSPEFLLGLAGGWYDGEFDYRDPRGLSGQAELDLAAVYPYLVWTQDARSAWATFGFGEGELSVHEADQRRDSDVYHNLGAFGLSQRFAASERIDTELRLEGLYSRLNVDGSGQPGGGLDYDGFTSEVWGLRSQGEVGWTFGSDDARDFSLRPYARLGLRLEEGDVPGLYGLESALGVDLNYAGLSLQAEGRANLLDEDSHVYAYSLSAAYDRHQDGRGLQLAVQALQGSQNRFDPFQATYQSLGTRQSDSQTQAELGYGLWLGRYGLLKPYIANRLGGTREQFETGIDYQFGRALRARLAFENIQPAANDNLPGQNEQRLSLKGNIRY